VRGSGTLTPEDIRWIPAQTQGRVERIVLHPGAQVKPDSVILELSNPELEQQVREAQLGYQAAQAAFVNRKAELQSGLLSQEADTANIEASYKQAALDLEANETLAKDGLVSEIQLKQKRSASDELKNRLDLAQKRLVITREGIQSQVAPQEADVNQKKAAWDLKRQQLEDLKVKAGMEGVLQCVCSSPTTQLDRGSSVAPGTNLARVANPNDLKAELRIAETQTKDIRIGQPAEIDTRNGIVKGHVSRIDPASSGGTVGVDVVMDEPLPSGARPDLSVDGTIRLDELKDVVIVGRPAFGQENSTVSIFKLQPNGEAISTKVKLGRASVNQIQVLDGLKPGDQVILSDMSQYDAFDRVQLKG
jgi:HlyD family secretion protein